MEQGLHSLMKCFGWKWTPLLKYSSTENSLTFKLTFDGKFSFYCGSLPDIDTVIYMYERFFMEELNNFRRGFYTIEIHGILGWVVDCGDNERKTETIRSHFSDNREAQDVFVSKFVRKAFVPFLYEDYSSRAKVEFFGIGREAY